MKRKLFSAILFGALLTASTSGLTSCKDYDDDISNLQSQIDKLATADQLSAEVSKLQTAIAAAQSAAESKAAAAEAVAKEAKEAAQKANDAASAANNAAKAAQDAADKLKAEAATKADLQEAAQAAQDAVTAIQAQLAKAATKDEVTTAIETAKQDLLAKINANTAKLTELDGKLAELAARLDAIEAGEGQEGDLAAIQAEVDAIADYLESLGISVSDMITSIDLYYRPNLGFDENFNLNFWKVKELANVFPEDKNIIAEDPYEFTANAVKLYEDSLLVRVNPVNAEICAEDVSLMNSQGTVLPEDLVKVVDVHRFEKNAPLTKAVAAENGLWVIKFKANDDLDEKEFNKYAKSGNNPVAFAVAVDNCDENLSADRRVVTDYNVGIATGTPKHATTFDVTTSAASKNVEEIHNRYGESENHTAVGVKEYVWKNGIAAVTPDFTDKTGNAVEGDNRWNEKVIIAELGEDITIKFPTNTKQPIKGFYVTLDWKRAVESGKTEINAWNSYSYENVAKVKADGTIIEKAKLQEGNVGYIKVTDLASMTMIGDIIGFRVFAVNLDGTLVDPDGIAFYIGIGKSDSEEKVSLGTKDIVIEEVTGNKKNVAYFPIGDQFDVDFDGAVEWSLNFKDKVTIGEVEYTRVVPALGTDYKISYVNDKGETKPLNQATKVKVQIINPAKFVDDETYNLEGALYKQVDNGMAKYLVRTVTAGVTKKLPVGLVPYNVKYNALQSEEFIVTRSAHDYQYVDVLDRDGNYKNANMLFAVDLKKFLVYDDANNTKLGTTGDWQLYGYNISNSVVDPNDNTKTIDAVANDGNNYNVVLGQQFADNSTVHSIKASYKYARISYAFRESGKNKADGVATWARNGYDVDDYYATAVQTPTIKYMTWSHIDNADFMTYKFRLTAKVNYAEAVSGVSAEVKEQVVPRNAIEWSTNGATIALGGTKCFKIDDIIWKAGVKSQQAISQALNSTNPQTTGDLDDLVVTGTTNKFLYIAEAWTMANGVKNAFFEPTVVAGELKGFKQVAPKSGEHAETLYIKVVDCFNAKTVIELPIQIVNSFANYVGNDGPVRKHSDW